MTCPYCGSSEHYVEDSRKTGMKGMGKNIIYRKRKCKICHVSFQTVEQIWERKRPIKKALTLASGVDEKHEYILLIRNKEG